MQEDKFTRSLT